MPPSSAWSRSAGPAPPSRKWWPGPTWLGAPRCTTSPPRPPSWPRSASTSSNAIAGEFAEAFEALRPEERTLEAAIDGLWGILCSPTWTAVIELGLASRTDPAIAVSFEGFTDRVDDAVLEIVGEYFPTLAQNPIGTAVVRGTLALLYGLALQTSIDGDRLGRHAEVVAQFKLLCVALAPALVATAPSATETPPTVIVETATPLEHPPDHDEQGDH